LSEVRDEVRIGGEVARVDSTLLALWRTDNAQTTEAGATSASATSKCNKVK
jgi:hypothetical protein